MNSRPKQIEHPGQAAPGPDELLALAREVIKTDAEALLALHDKLPAKFIDAVNAMLGCRGKVVVSGIGKSGHIARKIASTLASTGTPAFFVHPAEANHGDLGMISAEDVVLALSHSGESAELVAIVPLLKRQGATLIALTGDATSSLAQQADIHLDAGVDREACPLGLAPSASTTVALALGDALAFALLAARGFNADDFARSHPGGKLGRRLLVRVRDVMRTGTGVPRVAVTSLLPDVLLEMSRKGLGMAALVDEQGKVTGIYTDGDLRRTLERPTDLRTTPAEQVMTRDPATIAPDCLAAEAVRVMEQRRINGLLVVDEGGVLVGALNMHDLFRAGVV
jgi:arabinose-5-phosphate isomerase